MSARFLKFRGGKQILGGGKCGARGQKMRVGILENRGPSLVACV